LGSDEIEFLLASLFGQPLLGTFQSRPSPLKVNVSTPLGGLSQNRNFLGQGFGKSAADKNYVLAPLTVGIADSAGFQRGQKGGVSDEYAELS
jgi:hypothetical protein